MRPGGRIAIISFHSGEDRLVKHALRDGFRAVLTTLDPLDDDALIRILQEPKNALVKQYQKMFELEGIGLTFDPEAIRAVARKALERGTGARGLRAVLEGLMREIMFEVPSRDDVREVVVTPECVTERIPPLLVLRPETKKKEA